MVGAHKAFVALVGVLALFVGFAESQSQENKSQEHKIDGEV